jgi:signal transduction histidine kinase
MPFESLLLIIIAMVNIAFIAVLSSRVKQTTANRLFIAAIFFNIFWSIGDALFYGASNPDLARVGSQVFFISPMFTAYFLLLFARAFHDDKRINLFRAVALALPPLLLSVLIAIDSSLLLKSLATMDNINTFSVNTVPFIIYTLYFSLYFGLSYVLLFLKSRKKIGLEREQLRYILYAAIMSSFLALLSNLSLPLMGYTQYIWLGPLFTMFYVLIVALSIARHGLFDIRAAIARSLTYVATVSSIVLVYFLVILSLSGTNILAANLNSLQRAAFATVAVVSGFLFQPFKQFFDKFTNRVFYRDSYDAQVMIEELNKTLVNTVDLEALLTKTALIIQENLKTTYVTFYIRDTAYVKSRIIGAHRREPEIKSIEDIQEISKTIKKKVHSTQEPDATEYDTALNKLLRKNDFEIMARLVSTLDYEVKGVGLLFVGPKRSGSLYAKQDIKILEIIANELVIAIENILRFEEIEKFNETLQKKIDDATKELKQSNEKLRALDEAKDEFVSMASHQLRTPLTSIKGYLSMVLEGDAGKVSPTQKEMLGQAFFSSQRMVYLISDLLNVSRLKTGKFLIETRPVYLPNVVGSELDQLYDGAKAKNLKLSFSKPKEFSKLMLDEMKIRQVVMNFTDNAIYYTPSGGKIDVALKETKDSVEFTVTDNGIGVPKEQQHKLFAKFYRAENARKARPDGTGLGLFMAKKVIIAQGGSLIFKSREGKGSTFGFSFPKAKLLVQPKDD